MAEVAEVDARIAAIDWHLAVIAEIPPPSRTDEQWAELDRLLDARSKPWLWVRPSVPVIPGRSS